MRYIALFFLSVYQVVISPLIHAATGTVHACRYPVTCSEYTKKTILTYGVIQGSIMGMKRLSTCHPFQKGL